MKIGYVRAILPEQRFEELIDHSILHPTITDEDLRREWEVFRKYDVAVKVFEEKNACKDEAIEIDMVLNIGSGLVAHDKYGYLKGFEIAGPDQKFYYTKAVIEGDRVLVNNEKVLNPVAVRYVWSSNPPDANLYNKEGFPAAPFRTDTWPLPTEGSNYQNWIK